MYRHIPKILGTTLDVVTGLAEDDDGNVWVSSGSAFEGAFRWDGKAWKHFPVCNSCDGIYVHKIRKDRHGKLWFLGLGKSANSSENQPGAFVYENGTFTRWGKREGLASGRVYSFAEAEDGALWFGTYAGVSRWRPADPNLAKVPNLRKVTDSPPTHPKTPEPSLSMSIAKGEHGSEISTALAPAWATSTSTIPSATSPPPTAWSITASGISGSMLTISSGLQRRTASLATIMVRGQHTTSGRA